VNKFAFGFVVVVVVVVVVAVAVAVVVVVVAVVNEVDVVVSAEDVAVPVDVVLKALDGIKVDVAPVEVDELQLVVNFSAGGVSLKIDDGSEDWDTNSVSTSNLIVNNSLYNFQIQQQLPDAIVDSESSTTGDEVSIDLEEESSICFFVVVWIWKEFFEDRFPFCIDALFSKNLTKRESEVKI